MKKLIIISLVIALVASSLGIGAALAANGNSNKPPGKLAFNLNIIGRGNYGHQEPTASDYPGGGANNESRHTIFIPLVTDWYTDPCDTTGGQNNPGATAVPVLLPERGVTINIIPAPDNTFAVTDGYASKNNAAELQIPTGNARYDVYVVAKGKPGGCLDLEAYTYLDDTLIFIGSVDVDRGRAKPNRISITNLLYNPANGVEYFADPYEGYFWQLYNNGLRLMNVRFYEVSQ